MSSTNFPEPAGALDLNGMRILLVEDSWHLGMATKSLLQACGADVAGPFATVAEAERAVSERAPNAALVDFNLRGGERAISLIDRLHDQGVLIIVTSGYSNLPIAPGKVAAVLPKPISEAQLLESLRPLLNPRTPP
jgi:DNA-binding NtrC family response regulator